MAEIEQRFEAIGTAWHIEIFERLAQDVESLLFARIHERIAEFDQHYSRFRSDSLVTTMSNRAGIYLLPQDAKPLFDLYYTVYRLTSGAVTPLIGQVLSDTGYDAQYSFVSKHPQQPPTWDQVLAYNPPLLELKQPALLDLGAAGKGYLIDIVSQIIRDHGVTNFCVDAGGDIRYEHTIDIPLRVGLEHPEDPKQVIGVATINHGSICGSSGNRRTWGKYHHIIDPQSLESPRHIIAVWVIADTTLLADMLTTCLFFTRPEQLSKTFQFEYAIVLADYSITTSPLFPGEFFKK